MNNNNNNHKLSTKATPFVPRTPKNQAERMEQMHNLGLDGALVGRVRRVGPAHWRRRGGWE